MQTNARTARVAVSSDGKGPVSQAGAVLPWETMRVAGLAWGLPERLALWRVPRAVHDPGKIVADLAAAVTLGGDRLVDIAVLRKQAEFAGPGRVGLPRALNAVRAPRGRGPGTGMGPGWGRCPGADGS
jgi:hypothetical protein